MSDKTVLKNTINLKRLKELIDTKTREEIATAIHCDTSLITKHYNGNREITVDYVVKYAKYFNVSTDFLLGLTDVQGTDVEVRAICEYTGLNEEVVKKLHKYSGFEKTLDPEYALFTHLDFINYFIMSGMVTPEILQYKQSLKRCSKGLANDLEDIENGVGVNNWHNLDAINYDEYRYSRDCELDFYRSVKSFEKLLENYVEKDIREIEELSQMVEAVKPLEPRVYAYHSKESSKAGEINADNNQTE